MTDKKTAWKQVPVLATFDMLVAAQDAGTILAPRARRIYAAMLAAAPAHQAEKPVQRDWEITCDHCDGSGHVFVQRQVAERATDVQEFKEDCEACEGRGFVVSFQDIPGIQEYVRTCRPAPAVAFVRTMLDHPLLRDVLGYLEDTAPPDVWASAQSWMAMRDSALSGGKQGGNNG